MMAKAKKKKPSLTAAQRHVRLMAKIQKMEADIAYIKGLNPLIAEKLDDLGKKYFTLSINLQTHRVAETERFDLIRNAINTMYDEMPKALKPNGANAFSPPDAPDSPGSAVQPPPDQILPSA